MLNSKRTSRTYLPTVGGFSFKLNPSNAELNPISHLLLLLGTHHILHVSRIRVNAPCSGPGQCRQCSDSLWGGQSGDRIPVEARSSASVQTGPGAHLVSCTGGTGLFPGVYWPVLSANQPPRLSLRLKKE